MSFQILCIPKQRKCVYLPVLALCCVFPVILLLISYTNQLINICTLPNQLFAYDLK
jgi:hypothetical protein